MDKALKQRLVGASVLIILAVIVLPMLLSGRSDTLKQESRQIELPPKPDELSFDTRRFPVGDSNKPADEVAGGQDGTVTGRQQTGESAVAPGPDEATDTAAQPEVSDSKADTSDMNLVESTESDENVASSTIVKPPAVTSITLSTGRNEDEDKDQIPPAGETADTPRYLVQVASFSSVKNANALAGRLRADQLPVLMDVVERTAGSLHRVRVGPFADRAEADAVVTSLSAQMKDLSPRVLDLRPRESSPVSTPFDPLVRWVVQVGSFGSSKSAEALVAELRLGGLSAFSEKVSGADGTVYKVRIGPEIDRDKATELARRVKAEHQLDGFVTTQE